MPTYVLRVWMPDRPGALGAVASRIGAVRGDLTGIDILERDAGRAIDELVVEVPDESVLPLLLHEVGEVDGVDVESVREATQSLTDPRLDALETAALLLDQPTTDDLLLALVERAAHDFGAEWAVVLDDDGLARAHVGPHPSTAWLAAFVAGSRTSARVASGESGPEDITSVALGPFALALGRTARPFRARERRQLAALARIAASRVRASV
jgi:hypothetical protein